MHRRRGIIAAALLAILFVSCSPEKQSGRPETPSVAAAEALAINPEEREPLYIIQSLESGPFYFELSPGGPRLIPSPAEASLSPFIPWTQSRHISHFLPLTVDTEETLYAAVNRGGILKLANSGGKTAVYYTPGGESWKQYPLAAFFCHNQKPAALLARDRFFSVQEQEPPPFAVWALSGSFIQEISVPVLDRGGDPFWESAGLFLGRDDSWYIRKIDAENKSAYFRTANLSQPDEVIDAESYLAAASPLESSAPSVPPLLAYVIDEAARLAGAPCVVSLVSPVFPAKRLFSGGAAAANAANAGAAAVNSFALANNENAAELSGYYRPSKPGGEESALILFPDGRGLYGFSLGGAKATVSFALPALPPGHFVYTGIALLGARDVPGKSPGLLMLASWEEQENWNVGAAGFVLLEIGR